MRLKHTSALALRIWQKYSVLGFQHLAAQRFYPEASIVQHYYEESQGSRKVY